jgi:hypothetical protein
MVSGLDRIWASSFAVGGYGARIAVRVSRAELGPVLAARMSPGTKLTRPGVADRTLSIFLSGDEYHLYADNDLKARTSERLHLIDAFDTQLRTAFAEFSRKKLFVHGGVVGWKGKALLLPGKSLAGKTTLVAELVKAGATYFSDEYAVLDALARVHPFAKSLSIRDTPTARQRETPVEAFGGTAARRALPVGLVAMTQFRDGARWMPNRLPPAAGALDILANTIAARRWPALAMTVIGALVDAAPVIRSDRGDAARLAPRLLAMLDDKIV